MSTTASLVRALLHESRPVVVSSDPESESLDLIRVNDPGLSPSVCVISPPSWPEPPCSLPALEQEIGRRSVAEAIRPIKERTIASSSSAEKPITQEMVAEACDTLVRERHPASPPVWPEGSEIPARSDPERTRGTGILPEPPLPQRKTVSTPRSEGGGSPREAEQEPAPAVFSSSPVSGQEK